MKDPENGQSQNNDSENHGQIQPSEREWRSILDRAKGESDRFFRLYQHTKQGEDNTERLDTCARSMGWRVGADDESAPPAQDDSAMPPFPRVYSLHNTPESIAATALFRAVRRRWAEIWISCPEKNIPAHLGFTFAELIGQAELNLMLAIDAEDAMEFGLAVCLTKDAHSAINQHFAEMESLPPLAKGEKHYNEALRGLHNALFDLRDMCLRILNDARFELEGKDSPCENE